MSDVMMARPVCLTIGGSDSCGGAGIQADLRVFDRLGVYGCSAITALTAQNPLHIARIEPVSLAQLDAELHALFDYYDVAVVKTGMLLDAEHVAVVSGLLAELHHGSLVVDPVMISSSGSVLLDQGGVAALREALLPQAALITPNLDEADALLGQPSGYAADSPVEAVKALREALACPVLLKGGHADGDMLLDLLCDEDGGIHRFTHIRQCWDTGEGHGTGCRLASAVAAGLANQMPLVPAVEAAIAFLQECTA
ncbi:bifunctional hydroxymethylpyrimidine kinase/phosphomethylpyrimidine kinase [Mariprofundus ferrooxydans]|uniref:bifunctional hydroxymethylpyrimidine kinase/phosphomethylpyrimidine kinase n=1 Tax=Mariprofundus ferrooxydans TaxID=314344 RepID=UPI000377BE9A|nr:bifunctional hydroxymethylpyrimidine kinase/phosphomethylpyrimidine kinase [Mariprofundus ferrooxydans]